MKLGKARLVGTGLFLLFLLAAIPAYGQRGNFDINVGQTTDKFGSLAPSSGLDFDFTGQIAVIQREAKNSGPSIVAGGELRVSGDHSYHATEFAVYGGPAFRVHNFSIGLNAQVRKILLPPSTVNSQVFVRGNLELFQLPIVIKYKFGPAQRAFVEVQGEPEFTPRFLAPKTGVSLPKPNFDYGYTVRGSVGYTFGKWYAQGTYENRYFKFLSNPGNPNNLYNWKSVMVTGGAGITF
ncbi:MAG: hypothetical protein WA830_05835 [Candidatus Sulfotelmatobacter sp.]